MNFFKRKRVQADGTVKEGTTWYVRFRWRGRDVPRNTKCTNLADAKRYAAALLKALNEGREADVAAANLRAPVGQVTIGKILEAFDAAPGDWTPHTKRGYIGGLRVLVETALGAERDWQSRPVRILDGDLVFKFRQAVMKNAAQEDDARKAQLYRSANTALRSARAIFSKPLLEHYRYVCRLNLPNLDSFRDAPAFRGCGKDDYRIPSDELIRRTFADLESRRDSPIYAAVWLAMGFGLRKSEAAAVRAGWFIKIGGRVHLELRAVIQPGTPGQLSMATKNGAICPRIPVANGAWEKLEPIVKALEPDQHVLAPDTHATYRADQLFDELSAWLRGLGWETTKAFHEFRALAGCYVAMNDGLLVARDWLRHSSVTTTEKHYGRYVRTRVTDAIPATVLATAPALGHTGPKLVKETTVDADSDCQHPAQVVQFPQVGDATTCGTT